jgi:hypothetical protein
MNGFRMDQKTMAIISTHPKAAVRSDQDRSGKAIVVRNRIAKLVILIGVREQVSTEWAS